MNFSFKQYFFEHNNNLGVLFLEEVVPGRDIVNDPAWFDSFFAHNDYSYKKNKEVSSTMNKGDLEWRLKNHWTVFGNVPKPGMSVEDAKAAGVGYVMANDRGNFWKLVGSGGELQGIGQGLQELADTGKGIFGAMDARMAKILSRKLPAYMTPPASVVKLMYPMITQMREFRGGGEWEGVNPDGTVNYNMGGDMGIKTKAFVGTKPFFKFILNIALDKLGLDAKLLGMAKMMPDMAIKMAKQKGIDVDKESLAWILDVLEPEATAAGAEAPTPAPAPTPEPKLGFGTA
jgi:hypothetical protein